MSAWSSPLIRVASRALGINSSFDKNAAKNAETDNFFTNAKMGFSAT